MIVEEKEDKDIIKLKEKEDDAVMIDGMNDGMNDNILINQILIAKELEKEYEFEKVLKIYQNLSGKLPNSCETIIQKKIAEIQSKINKIINNGGYYYETSNSNYYLPGGFEISDKNFQKLTSYQRDGIKWVYSIFHEKECGCILADDKELDKENQVINIIYGLYNSMKAGRFLVIVSLEKLPWWERKIRQRLQSVISICIFNSKTKNRQEIINHIKNTAGILITTYEMITHNYSTLLINWDFVICDDSCKKVNNYKTKRYQALYKIETNFKILLSDIPLPNKFFDIYSIFNYLMKNNKIFGTYEEFKNKYIISKNSSKTNITKTGNIPNENLQRFIQHFVLRREKDNQEEFEKDIEESEYSEICDENSDDYDDLKDFIIEDEEYMEDEDIDENDKQYSNIYWKEKYYSVKTQSDLKEDDDLNQELLELKLDHENINKSNNIKLDISNNTLNKGNISDCDMNVTKNDYISDDDHKNLLENYNICNYCNKIIIENEDGSIQCSLCGNFEHFACTGVPYDINTKKDSVLRYYFCHKCRNSVIADNFYSFDSENKSSIEYDKSLDSKLVKENDYIIKHLQIEDTYDRILNNSCSTKNDIKMEEKYKINDDNNILNITGKFGMETSIDNLSSIIKNSYGNITYNFNNDDTMKFNSLSNENYQKNIEDFKIYLEKNDKINALNSLLKANKINSNDLNLHWWIIKIIIDLNII